MARVNNIAEMMAVSGYEYFDLALLISGFWVLLFFLSFI